MGGPGWAGGGGRHGVKVREKEVGEWVGGPTVETWEEGEKGKWEVERNRGKVEGDYIEREKEKGNEGGGRHKKINEEEADKKKREEE